MTTSEERDPETGELPEDDGWGYPAVPGRADTREEERGER